MKKRKAAAYIGVIASLIALSIVTPLLISSASDFIAGKIRKSETEKIEETETVAEREERPEALAGYESLYLESESEENTPGRRPSAVKTENSPAKASSFGQVIADEDYYDEPVYDTREEEDAANKEAYEDMEERLLSASEAAALYRKNFNPVYDELSAGLMNLFISGREQTFYEDIANYCFGRYNTTSHIAMVRFDAMTERSESKETVILEFFTDEALTDESKVPDLAYCSYNKRTLSFVFFTGGR